MKWRDVVAKVNAMDWPANSCVVFGSCPMALAGLRESRDIDLFVSPELYDKLKKDGWETVIKGPKDKPLVHDVFEAHRDWEFSSYAPKFEELLERATVVDGIPFASLTDVRKWKAASGRPKDIADIKLIDNYLSKAGP